MDTDLKILEKTKNAWLVHKHGWSYQKWCPQLRKLVADTAKKEIPLQAMCQHLSEMRKLMDGGDSSQVCGQQSYDNRDVGGHRKVDTAFLLEVSTRGDKASTLFELLKALDGSSIWQVVGAQMKRVTLRRSGLGRQALGWH